MNAEDLFTRSLFGLVVIGFFCSLAVFYYFMFDAAIKDNMARQNRDNKIDSVLEKLAEDKECGQ